MSAIQEKSGASAQLCLATRCLTTALAGMGFCLVAVLTGCPSQPSEPSGSSSSPAEQPARAARVVAQGQIMPAGGIVKIYSAPGDVVVELPVAVGARVTAGQVLARLRSEATIASQRAALGEQKRSAERTRAGAIRQAELQLTAARLKLEQIRVKQASLNEQSKLLELGQKQVTSSLRMLQSIQRISADTLTREFMGQIEVDRQSLAVDDAQLKFLQQQQNHRDATQEIALATQAAEHEIVAAEAALSMAKESDPGKVFDLQATALNAEAERSVIVASSDSVVLAINAAVGGAAIQTPLIELANIDLLVCEAEINVEDAAKVAVGQTVAVRSRAFDQTLTGVVSEKSRLVGRPRLRSLDPFAAVDYRTLTAIIALDNPALAKDWLQLQVEIEIDLQTSTGSK